MLAAGTDSHIRVAHISLLVDYHISSLLEMLPSHDLSQRRRIVTRGYGNILMIINLQIRVN